MKMYIPQKGDIFTLEKDWYIELPSDLKKKYLNEENFIPVGSKLTITKYVMAYHKIFEIKIKIIEINGKKINMMNYHSFSVNLNDFNSMYVETNELSGTMNIDLIWHKNTINQLCGVINDEEILSIENNKVYYLNKFIGEYSSIDACKKNALKYIKNNFFKNKIRKQKIKTLF
jgi:hypothetical protein